MHGRTLRVGSPGENGRGRLAGGQERRNIVNRIYLSHFLGDDTPFYGGDETFQVESVRSIAAGDVCNTSRWSFLNHAGTHVDLPLHFFSEAKACKSIRRITGFFQRSHYWIFPTVCQLGLSARKCWNKSSFHPTSSCCSSRRGPASSEGLRPIGKPGRYFAPRWQTICVQDFVLCAQSDLMQFPFPLGLIALLGVAPIAPSLGGRRPSS
ncbi:cyclase family protein [Geobacter anodireducens]